MPHTLHPHFEELRRIDSTHRLRRSPLFQRLEPEIVRLFEERETGSFSRNGHSPKERYRAIAWNIERGTHYSGIEKTLKQHPGLKEGDLYLLTETDWGMARSGNRHVTRDLAEALGMNYFFAPSYLNLCLGSGIESEVSGENSHALHGNSILSRYPIENPRSIPLKNAKDKFKGKEKRLGQQRALACEIRLPEKTVTAVCVHLDAHSSQRHRAEQMKTVLEALRGNRHPILMGGDWNTSTYNSRRATTAIIGFWRRVFMGTGYVIDNHYQHPDRYFERKLFRSLEAAGFDYKNFNQPGGGTIHYRVDDIRASKNLGDWIPQWCFRFIEWSLKDHNGECPLKLDWFASRGLRPFNPRIVGNLTDNGVKLSDHDAIVVDFAAP